ncbi:SOS response-associated peptidase [Oscillatoria sp. FACHB-1406]|uniref:SOS response-associated peptidase n=1 Tax=Oscillatoria sp. FACHB-1406 TaxID=2692846 RepID=UPI001688EE15|nr:SOS response-associated peptidase [Oscillatoria sp. FACHB-1406]MBD2580429.1 SOS response-associated peptidase [Oscillatoria sp. FACHB-1406]
MCGRFTQTHSAESLARTFQLADIPQQAPRYNIAPTQTVSAVIHSEGTTERSFKSFHWGLIPSWAKDTRIASKLINARSETVAEKPSFRSAFRRRRCLIVADGFYEWQAREAKKQPFYIQVENGEPFAFAGLWETWKDTTGESIESCTILTTEANETMQPLHARMPVILNPKDWDFWLDTSISEPEPLKSLLIPYQAEAMSAYPVSAKVNNPRYDRADCLERLEGERSAS